MTCGESKSVKGGPNPLVDMDRGVQIRGGVQICCDTGLTHNSGPQVLASQILVSPQTLEVNKILPTNLSFKLSTDFIYYS